MSFCRDKRRNCLFYMGVCRAGSTVLGHKGLGNKGLISLQRQPLACKTGFVQACKAKVRHWQSARLRDISAEFVSAQICFGLKVVIAEKKVRA